MAGPEGQTPPNDGPDIDAAFADIVARLREPPTDEPSPRPPSARPDPVPWRVDPSGSVADALLGDQQWEQDEDDDEGFVPGPTAPLPPRRDRTFWMALLGLTIGPALVLWVALVGPGGIALMRLGILAMVAGFVALVVRQPTRRGDDPDHGARV